ncbi:MAG: hypothetical protein JJ866_10385 [Roseibium sp.]|uniref:hypothetical protein n=1 Tax=Roseibium sp. TaxID=1936156 RepID=UPI001B13314D|nr:hypothetical protein [Roseibium sp.]MBO6892336.1 hypothetical protein [Roseibium sp.]MBO6929013.1 hypothetical protein [Roseibium sp.]
MRLKFLSKSLAAAALVTTLGIGSALAETKFVILDILPLKEGASVEDAKAYFDKIEPILARHGMTRNDQPLDVVKFLRGSAKAQVINLWNSENPEASFQGVFGDEEYRSNIPNRDRIFNLKEANIIITERDASN